MNNQTFPTVTSAQSNYTKRLQQYLRALSYEYDEIPRIAVDGVAGPETEEAIKAFQQLVGLEPTGVADPLTWELLHNQYMAVRKANERPYGFEGFPSIDTVFQSGDSHPIIYSVQHIFWILSRLFSNFLVPDFTGIIDNKTAQNIREFRSIARLAPGTSIDRDLWNILVLTHNSLNRHGLT